MVSTQNAMSIKPQQARLVVEDCMELLGQITYEITALRALICPPTAWGQLGAPAAAGTQQWMQQLNQALALCVAYHEQLQRLIRTAGNRYESADQAEAASYSGLLGGHQHPC